VLASGSSNAAAEVKPLWRLVREELLRSDQIVRRRDNGAGARPRRWTLQGRVFWVLARDDRPWRGGAPPAVVYNYMPGCGGEHAMALLKGYAGQLQIRRLCPLRQAHRSEAGR